MTNEPEWMKRYEELNKNCIGHYDIFLPPEVKSFIKEEKEKSYHQGCLQGCLDANAYWEGEIEQAKAELLSKIEEEVNRNVRLYHKTCLTKMFDNGKFWAYKDMQEFIKKTLSKYKAL